MSHNSIQLLFVVVGSGGYAISKSTAKGQYLAKKSTIYLFSLVWERETSSKENLHKEGENWGYHPPPPPLCETPTSVSINKLACPLCYMSTLPVIIELYF